MGAVFAGAMFSVVAMVFAGFVAGVGTALGGGTVELALLIHGGTIGASALAIVGALALIVVLFAEGGVPSKGLSRDIALLGFGTILGCAAIWWLRSRAAVPVEALQALPPQVRKI